MSIENTAPTGAETTTPVELQNANAQFAPDGAGMEPSSDAQPQDAADQEDRNTPEHRTARYRFGEMSKQIRDLQLEIARRDGMLAALRGAPQPGFQAQAQNAPTPVPEAPAPQAPNPADFAEGQYDPRYLDALAEYKARVILQQELDQRSKHWAEEQQKEAERRAFEQGQQRFFTVMDQAEKAGATGATRVLEIVGRDRQAADLLVSTAHPVETADWLADNQEWLQAITRERDPVRKALLVGRVDQHIASHLASQRAQSSARSSPAQTTQAAPGPQGSGPAASSVAQPTVKAGTGGAPFNPASASFEQYEAWRKANPHA